MTHSTSLSASFRQLQTPSDHPFLATKKFRPAPFLVYHHHLLKELLLIAERVAADGWKRLEEAERGWQRLKKG